MARARAVTQFTNGIGNLVWHLVFLVGAGFIIIGVTPRTIRLICRRRPSHNLTVRLVTIDTVKIPVVTRVI